MDTDNSVVMSRGKGERGLGGEVKEVENGNICKIKKKKKIKNIKRNTLLLNCLKHQKHPLSHVIFILKLFY